MKEENYLKQLKQKDVLIDKYRNEIAELKRELEYYKKEACTDKLTKLNNRRSIEEAHDFDSLILGDIDFFKKINDTYGHDFGDEVLIEIGKVLKENVGKTDLVCRWGGEEFVILLKNCDIDDAYDKATILKEQIADLGSKFGFNITMSFGVSSLANKTMQIAIKEADEAMYNSKNNGRNRVTIYSLNLS